MQTGEYHGFAGQFPDWLRAQAVTWRGPLLVSILIHACLFWPQGQSQSGAGALLGGGRDGLQAQLKPAAAAVYPAARVTGPEPVRHATVTQTSSRRRVQPEIGAHAVSPIVSTPAAAMTVSDGVDPGAQRSYRVALARMLAAGDLHRALPGLASAGALEIGIALSASGQLKDVAVLRGSGSAALDAVVLAAVRQAALAAPIPAAMRGRDLVIALPVEVGAATSAADR